MLFLYKREKKRKGLLILTSGWEVLLWKGVRERFIVKARNKRWKRQFIERKEGERGRACRIEESVVHVVLFGRKIRESLFHSNLRAFYFSLC